MYYDIEQIPSVGSTLCQQAAEDENTQNSVTSNGRDDSEDSGAQSTIMDESDVDENELEEKRYESGSSEEESQELTLESDDEVDEVEPSKSRANLVALQKGYNTTPVILLVRLLPEEDINPNFVLPKGYKGKVAKGIIIENSDRQGNPTSHTICRCLTWISRRMKDLETAEEFMEISWYKDNQLQKKIVRRTTIAIAREIGELISYGLLFTSLGANEMVQYYADFESQNTDHIPLECYSSKLGWQADGSFLLGKKLFSRSDRTNNNLSFHALNVGENQLASGYASKGSLEFWCEAANNHYDHPMPFIMVMASLAAPFVKVLGVPNFIVDLAGETSKGKTKALVFAASAWGNPDISSPNRTIHSWQNTQVWIETTASTLNSLPLMLDDTKTAQNSDIVGEVIYSFVSGRGKGRGSLRGTRECGCWKSILLSTGEQSAVDFSIKHGGTRARVLTLWGSPFGDTNQAALVKELEAVALENYGHAGPKVVQFIQDNQDDIPLWKEALKEAREHFSSLAGDNSVADRLSEILAFFATVIPIIHKALPALKSNRPIPGMLEGFMTIIGESAPNADRAKEALAALSEYAVSNQSKFSTCHSKHSEHGVREPFNGWAGRWDIEDNWNYIGFTTETAENVLNGFEFKAIINSFRERDWLLRGNKGNQKNVKINNIQCSLYCIKREVFETELELEGKEKPEFKPADPFTLEGEGQLDEDNLPCPVPQEQDLRKEPELNAVDDYVQPWEDSSPMEFVAPGTANQTYLEVTTENIFGSPNDDNDEEEYQSPF